MLCVLAVFVPRFLCKARLGRYSCRCRWAVGFSMARLFAFQHACAVLSAWMIRTQGHFLKTHSGRNGCGGGFAVSSNYAQFSERSSLRWPVVLGSLSSGGFGLVRGRRLGRNISERRCRPIPVAPARSHRHAHRAHGSHSNKSLRPSKLKLARRCGNHARLRGVQPQSFPSTHLPMDGRPEKRFCKCS